MRSFIRKEVLRLKGYSLRRPPHQIKLNQNESPYDLPLPLKRKVLERLKNLSWNRYPTPFCDSLRKKIAEGEGWSEEGVIVAGGSNILIQAITIACAVRGKILTVTPSFSLYGIEGLLLGNRIEAVPLSPADFSLQTDRLLKRLKQSRPNLFFIANPNAPTGNLFSEEDLLALLQMTKRLGLPFVVDEAYYPFSRFTLAPYLKRFPQLILLRTLSKAFSLGGVRLGYLLAQPKVAREILKVVLPFSVGVLSQAVGEVVLEDRSYLPPLVDEIIGERERLFEGLKQLPSLKVTRSRANFLLFQSPRAKFIFEKLLQGGILIRDVSNKNLPGGLRVTVGSPQENRLFLDLMGKISLTPSS